MSTISIIIIIVIAVIIAVFAYLSLSFLLIARGLDIRELEAKKVINKNNYSDPVYYDYEYYKKHLVEEEREAIESLHNSFIYQSLSDEKRKEKDEELRSYLHIKRKYIEGMIREKHDFIENPLNI